MTFSILFKIFLCFYFLSFSSAWNYGVQYPVYSEYGSDYGVPGYHQGISIIHSLGLRLEIDVHLVSRGSDGYDVVSSARRISVNLPEGALLPSVAPANIAGIINPFDLSSPAGGAAPGGGVARGGGFEDISDAEGVRHCVLSVFSVLLLVLPFLCRSNWVVTLHNGLIRN